MAKWEYRTLLYGTPHSTQGVKGRMRGVRQWVMTAATQDAGSANVGEAQPARFIGKLWQANCLLESALSELDQDDWELVSVSFSGIFAFYGTAIVKRPAGLARPETVNATAEADPEQAKATPPTVEHAR